MIYPSTNDIYPTTNDISNHKWYISDHKWYYISDHKWYIQPQIQQQKTNPTTTKNKSNNNKKQTQQQQKTNPTTRKNNNNKKQQQLEYGPDLVVAMESFGASAPAKALRQHYGFTPDAVAQKVLDRLWCPWCLVTTTIVVRPTLQ